MLRAVLCHGFRQLIVHVIFNVGRLLFNLWRFFTNDLGTHRALRGECLGDRLSLEAHHGFCNHRVEHTASALPRFRSFLNLQTQELQAINVSLLPLFARLLVVVNVRHQIASQRLQGAIIHVLGQVVTEAFFVFFTGLDADLHAIDADVDFFGINNLDLQGGFVLRQLFDASGLLVQRFVDVRCHVYS